MGVNKKRSEGFFGLHFDFHAGSDCTEIGKNVTEESIREIIETLHPDYIQCDCKGHAGYSSYMTNAGNRAPGFVNDQLKTWRKVTAEYDIPLVMHYSGVFDTKAIELNPDWAAINEDGSINKNMTSTFGGYADKLLIPQLVELANEYGVDAVWVDGECWAAVPDFNEKVLALFEKECGCKIVKNEEGKYDKKSTEYRKFLEFNRNQFKKYLDNYAKEVHRKTKGFEVASNWAFSSHIPEPVSCDVDYLSGDFTPVDSYNGARFEARVLCEQDKPWDLMAWGFYFDFSSQGVKATKGMKALCREAASVISLGGGYQIYNTQNRDGSVKLWEVKNMSGINTFMRQREEALHHSKPFSNIGILYSRYDLGSRQDGLFFAGGNDMVKGAVKMVLDGAKTCRLIMDHMLEDFLADTKNILILPEILHLCEYTKEKILNFVKSGGNVIFCGYELLKTFGSPLEIDIKGEPKTQAYYLQYGTRYVAQYGRYADFEIKDADIISEGSNSPDVNSVHMPVIYSKPYGNGKFVVFGYNVFETYNSAPDYFARNLLSDIIDTFDSEKFLIYKGEKFVDITTAKKCGKLIINIINTSGIYTESRIRAYDEILPIYNAQISVKAAEPKSVKIIGQDTPVQYCYDRESSRVSIKLDKIEIHSVVVIE